MTNLLTTASVINKAIDSIARRGKALDLDIQVAALSCLNHHNEHGDITLLNRLWNAMPRGSRRKSLTDWILHFGAVQANTADDKKENPFADARKIKALDLAGATETPWFEFNRPKSEDEVTEFDFVGALEKLVQRAAAAQAKGMEIKGADVLADLIAKYSK